MQQEEETRSGFLFKNLFRGLIGFLIIISLFILFEDYIVEVFEEHKSVIRANTLLMYSIYTLSEIVFGILPPELFMLILISSKVTLVDYCINLTYLTLISYAAGVLGYFIGKYFSKTSIYKRIGEKYMKPYEGQLKRFGGYLVFVGAVTPIPFSATCMLAGSINYPINTFLLICITRTLRFAIYGWMVWSFPNWFSV
jgi:membrane protein YqaA with SNARE-associated domain